MVRVIQPPLPTAVATRSLLARQSASRIIQNALTEASGEEEESKEGGIERESSLLATLKQERNVHDVYDLRTVLGRGLFGVFWHFLIR